MMEGLAYLREMNVASVLLRLTVAMLFGGFIGLERGRAPASSFGPICWYAQARR